MDEKRCCGTCAFHTSVSDGDWVCSCEESEAYTDYTFFDQECGEWVSRKDIEDEAN